MYRILASNVEKVAEQGLNKKDKEISVAVLESDFNKENPKLYPFRQGMIYDIDNEYKPNIKGAQTLPKELVTEYESILAEARKTLHKLKVNNFNNGGNNSAAITALVEDLQNKEAIINIKENEVKALNQEIESLKNRSAAAAVTPNLSQLDELVNGLKNLYPTTIKITVNDEEKGKLENPVLHEKFEQCLRVIAKKFALLLKGDAGTGKNVLAEQIAKALDLRFIPENAITQEYKVTGFKNAAGLYESTAFREAFENGGLFFFDEIDASIADAMLVLNSALANGYFNFPDKLVYAHKDFRVIAAANTFGTGANSDYSGRNKLDGATLNRFKFIEIDYSPKIEEAIAKNDIELLEFVRALRKSSRDNELGLIVSYRQLTGIVEFMNDLDIFTIEEVLELNILLGALGKDNLYTLYSDMKMNGIDIKNKYVKAFKKIAA